MPAPRGAASPAPESAGAVVGPDPPAAPVGPVGALDLLFVAWIVGLVSAGWTALVLAELSLFFGAAAATLCLGAGLAAGLATARVARAGGRVQLPRPGVLTLVAVVGLVAAATYWRPHEHVLGGLDPGVYVATGVLVAQTGGLVWSDPELPALSAAGRAALFREAPQRFAEGSRLIGFYLVDTSAGRSVPHGLHLFPSTLAIAFALGGLPALWAVPPLLALSGIGGVALIARKLAGTPGAVLAAGFLIVNPAELWFGRYPAAETFVQSTFFGGLAILWIALERRSTALAAVAGLVLGTVHLAKVDFLGLPAAILVALGWLLVTGRLGRPHVAFAAGYTLMLGHAALHVTFVATHYAYSALLRFVPSVSPTLVLPLLVVALALVLVAGWPERVRRLERWRDHAWLLLCAVVIALAGYGWYVRPLDLWGDVAAASVVEPYLGVMARNRLHALPRLGWFVPPLAILLAVVGFLLTARRARAVVPAVLLTALGLESLIVLAEARITPEYPWAARRWVGTIVPGALLLAAVSLAWAMPRRLSADVGALVPRLARFALPGALGLVIWLTSVGSAASLASLREQTGVAALVDRIAATMPPDAIVLFDPDEIGYRLSAPLQFLGRRTTFVLFGEASNDERVAVPVAEWERRGRWVYWLRAQDPGPAYYRWGRYWRPLTNWRLTFDEMQTTTEEPPSARRRFDVPLTLYQMLTTES